MTIRRQVTLQRRAASTSTFGDDNGTWSDVSALGASISVLSSAELVRGGREVDAFVLRFEIPRGPISTTITTNDRIVFNNIAYNVSAVNSIGIRGGMVIVVGEE